MATSEVSQVLVSAIIPTYNRADFVCTAIDSVLAQTWRNIEIIVVDDGSADNTRDVIATYGDRVRYFYQDNAGASAARNRGIAESSGVIVAFLDSDDTWLPTKIEEQVRALERAGESVPCCIANIRLRYADGKVKDSFGISILSPGMEEGVWLNPLEVLLTRFLLFNQSVAVRRTALLKVGGFNHSLRYMEDYDLALKLACLGPWAFIARPLTIWNEGSNGSLSAEAQRGRTTIDHTVCTILADLGRQIDQVPLVIGASRRRRNQLAFESRRSRARLRAHRQMEAGGLCQRRAGRLLHLGERLFDSLYTHSWFYPTMRVRAFVE
jgi:glycosyltransferase involved in cell wall biosynthesis